jgi:hypothetical protein
MFANQAMAASPASQKSLLGPFARPGAVQLFAGMKKALGLPQHSTAVRPILLSCTTAVSLRRFRPFISKSNDEKSISHTRFFYDIRMQPPLLECEVCKYFMDTIDYIIENNGTVEAIEVRTTIVCGSLSRFCARAYNWGCAGCGGRHLRAVPAPSCRSGTFAHSLAAVVITHSSSLLSATVTDASV